MSGGSVFFVFFLLLSSFLPWLATSIRIQRYFGHFEQDRPNVEYLDTAIGSNLTLDCPIILESNDEIYSMKWFRLNNGTYYEFFSYIFSPNQTIHHKSLPGIQIDLDAVLSTTGERMFLVNVNPGSAGIYRCEVISDETFQVDRKEFNLTVFVPPMEVPRIIFPKKTYSIGEHVQLKCLTGFSKIEPQIRWFLNKAWPLAESTVDEGGEESMKNGQHHHQWMGMMMTMMMAAAADRPTSTSTINHRAEYGQDHHRRPNASNTNMIQSILNHEQLGRRRISFVDFILEHQHVSRGSDHFSVSCVSMIETKIYPPSLSSSSSASSSSSSSSSTPSPIEDGEHGQVFDGKVWANHLATPIIEGLQDQYRLGDFVDVECRLPLNRIMVATSVIAKIKWTINGRKIDRRKVKEVKYDHKNGYSRLRFELAPKHMDRNGSFNLKCEYVQKWITNDDDIPDDEDSQAGGTADGYSANYNATMLQRMKDLVLTRPASETLKAFGPVLIPFAVVIVVIIIG